MTLLTLLDWKEDTQTYQWKKPENADSSQQTVAKPSTISRPHRTSTGNSEAPHYERLDPSYYVRDREFFGKWLKFL
jgi:hypothetical protein